MKITSIETIQLAEFPAIIWIQVKTDSGHVGLGETFFGPKAVAGCEVGLVSGASSRHHAAILADSPREVGLRASYSVPDGFFMGVDVDKATPKSGVPSSFQLIRWALGDRLRPQPSSALSFA